MRRNNNPQVEIFTHNVVLPPKTSFVSIPVATHPRLLTPYLSKSNQKHLSLLILVAVTLQQLTSSPSKSNQNHLLLPFWWPTILG
jgi:hypothetical protein